MRLIRNIKAKSPVILAVLSCLGVVTTAVMAVKATPKAKLLIAQADMRKGERLSKMEMAVVAAPAYLPAVAVGGATIFSILSATVISYKRQAGLSSAYILMEKSFRAYREAANEVYGEDADEKISSQIAMDNFKQYCISQDDLAVNETVPEGEEIPLFYEEIGNRYFNRTFLDVQAAEYHLNRNLMLRGYCSLNEFYSFLGLDPIEGGDDIGWGHDEFWDSGFGWIDFYHTKMVTDDGLECWIIHYMFNPGPLW